MSDFSQTFTDLVFKFVCFHTKQHDIRVDLSFQTLNYSKMVIIQQKPQKELISPYRHNGHTCYSGRPWEDGRSCRWSSTWVERSAPWWSPLWSETAADIGGCPDLGVLGETCEIRRSDILKIIILYICKGKKAFKGQNDIHVNDKGINSVV